MEALAAKCAGYEIFLVAKRATEVTHLLEDKERVVERTVNRIAVVTTFIVLLLVSLHHLLSALFFIREVVWIEN